MVLLVLVNDLSAVYDGTMDAQVKLCRRVDKQTGQEEWVAVKVFNKSLLNRQARGFAFGRRKKDHKVRTVPLKNRTARYEYVRCCCCCTHVGKCFRRCVLRGLTRVGADKTPQGLRS